MLMNTKNAIQYNTKDICWFNLIIKTSIIDFFIWCDKFFHILN